jgi:hypothetical protein
MLGYAAARRFLATTSAEERTQIQVLAVAARRVQAEHDHERAIMIANSVAKVFGA